MGGLAERKNSIFRYKLLISMKKHLAIVSIIFVYMAYFICEYQKISVHYINLVAVEEAHRIKSGLAMHDYRIALVFNYNSGRLRKIRNSTLGYAPYKIFTNVDKYRKEFLSRIL